ncbi:hypothetical protein BV22DRAFT_1128773 [Leucogyrophana mollusca]|uniref:Uncharacterized protein n=1 Tax=Leucogyrophana mollusca TaxID=85980 RepID=A0ACB8BJT1_9AGAM|nr:hypothetical protein BV22DRAFT_1128773 [Leucogyrophana mollusca]
MSGTVAHGTIQTGTYTISNIATTGFATLADGNNGSSLTQSTDSGDDTVKFTVNKLSNGKYNILGYVYANYASVSASPKKGDDVKARSSAYQWQIKETNTKSQYLISPDDDDSLYWGFSGSSATNVKLTDDGSSVWQFTRITD